MSPIHFNSSQDVHSSSPLLHFHPHEVVEDVSLGRKKEIHDLKFTILKSYNHHHHHHHQYGDNGHYHNKGTSSSSSSSAKWESPKMRSYYHEFMKSNDDDQTVEDQSMKQDGCPRENCGENSTNNIRICADCGTTKTPLWRSGPHGPKSLCNACGIRQRKARRAAMAASDTACATSSSSNTTKFSLLPKDMRFSPKMKKRSKNRAKKPLMPNNIDQTATQTKKICFQEFALNLSNKLSLHQLFPQDEKEAAILLMALSSGFVEG